ncbi:MAG: cyclic-di-AMP receptor [Symbiobacteriaceae bacterium]
MKLIVAVVRDEYTGQLTDALTRKGLGATKLSSTGGFLKAGNTTFLIGVRDDQLEEALGAIRHVCPGSQVSQGSPKAGKAAPQSSATVFILGVERMLKV